MLKLVKFLGIAILFGAGLYFIQRITVDASVDTAQPKNVNQEIQRDAALGSVHSNALVKGGSIEVEVSRGNVRSNGQVKVNELRKTASNSLEDVSSLDDLVSIFSHYQNYYITDELEHNAQVLTDALDSYFLDKERDIQLFDQACNDDGCILAVSFIGNEKLSLQGIPYSMRVQQGILSASPELGKRFKNMTFQEIVEEGNTYFFYRFNNE